MAGQRLALIVASYDYEDPRLRRLRAPARDAEALAGVLGDGAIGGFEVSTLLNQPSHVIGEAVEDLFADRTSDDLLLLHLSCHGVKDENGDLYFAAANTRLARLGATAVGSEFVNRLMHRSRSRRIVLFLDCCYAGAYGRGLAPRAGPDVGIQEHLGGRGRAVITASSAMEFAYESDEPADDDQPSVFTRALVEGLATGEADRDQDGLVGLDELYDYVYDRVREATSHQTPGKWALGIEGDLYVARRARPVTTPAPLPAEVQDAIGSPFSEVRAGVVQVLQRLLQGRHAGHALGAQQALERLAEDDSRMVSAAAKAALTDQEPAPRPPPPPPPPQSPPPPSHGPESPVEMSGVTASSSVPAAKQTGGIFISHDGRVERVVFSPDGRILASLDDGCVWLCDVTSGRTLSGPVTGGFHKSVKAMAFSPDGQTLAVAGAFDVRLCDMTRIRRLAVAAYPLPAPAGRPLDADGIVQDVAFSPDGQTLAIVVTTGVELWSATKRRWAGRRFGKDADLAQSSCNAAAFAPDGKALAVIAQTGVRLWDVASRRFAPNVLLATPAGVVKGISFSPDGRILVALTSVAVHLWDLTRENHRIDHPLTQSAVGAVDLAFDPAGTRIATANRTGDVTIWDVTGGRVAGPFATNAGHVTSVTFSPDGRDVATGSADGTVRLWRLAGDSER